MLCSLLEVSQNAHPRIKGSEKSYRQERSLNRLLLEGPFISDLGLTDHLVELLFRGPHTETEHSGESHRLTMLIIWFGTS